MTNEMINEKVKKIRELEEQAATLKAEIDSLKDELRAELDSRKEDSMETLIYRIFYNCYTRNGIDSAKLKKAGLYDEYAKQTVCTQFLIKEINPI